MSKLTSDMEDEVLEQYRMTENLKQIERQE